MRRYALILSLWLLAMTVPGLTQTWEWTNLPDMPTARYGHCSVVFQEKIWVIGGKSRLNMTMSEVDCFDLNTGQWLDDVPDMITPRFNASALVHQGKIFVFGGSGFLTNKLNSVEYYDPQTNSWHEFEAMNYEREGLTSVVLNDTLFVLGGTSGNGWITQPLDIVEYWHEQSSSWKVSNHWRLRMPRVAMQSLVINNMVFTFGGVSVAPLNQVEMYQSGHGSLWLSPLPRERFYFASVAVRDSIFCLGGYGITGTMDSIDFYNVKTNTWATLDMTLTAPRAGLSAVEYDGAIYIFGGLSETSGVLGAAQRLNYNSSSVVAAIDALGIPDHFSLLGNYPNPFNAGTIVEFEIGAAQENVQLEIFNILGAAVRAFDMDFMQPGKYQIFWDGRDEFGRPLESGIYFARLTSAHARFDVLRMSLIK